MDQGTTGSAAGRWIALVLTMGAAGWAAYTLYERTAASSASTPVVETPKPDDVAKFIVAAQAHLMAGKFEDARTELIKASGVDSQDERVLEGLALVAVMKAESSWWQAELGKNPKAAVARLDHEVDAARQAIAKAQGVASSESAKTRLRLYDRRLNTFVVVSFARLGDKDRAAGALHARLGDHPQRDLIEAYLASDGKAGAGGKGTDGALDDEETIPPDPKRPAAGQPAPAPHGGHFEFDSEPELHGPTTTGELQLPGTTN